MKNHAFRTCLALFSLFLLLSLSGIRASAQTDKQPAGKAVTAAEALAKLKEGNARFVADKPADRKLNLRRTETAEKQKPFAIILTCADSRVGPELVFDQSLGDLFVVRVAGNTAVDASVLGSIEYAVAHLHAPLIVVLGHEKCGAVAAALEGGQGEGNIGAMVKQVYVGDKSGKDQQAKIVTGVRTNAKYQSAELLKRSKLVSEMVKGERVQVVTAIYNLQTGEVEWLGSPILQNGK
jgi:carbonic anhydrase